MSKESYGVKRVSGMSENHIPSPTLACQASSLEAAAESSQS